MSERLLRKLKPVEWISVLILFIIWFLLFVPSQPVRNRFHREKVVRERLSEIQKQWISAIGTDGFQPEEQVLLPGIIDPYDTRDVYVYSKGTEWIIIDYESPHGEPYIRTSAKEGSGFFFIWEEDHDLKEWQLQYPVMGKRKIVEEVGN